ncbi:MAG: N-acetylmuramoyl-L-alanine amidase [Elusimicrobiota bacterium]
MSLISLLTAAFLVLPAASVRAAEEVAVVVSGKPSDPVTSFKIGAELYLDAKRVGSIYGGQVYWYPVSGRVQLSMRGRTLQFVVDSDKAASADQTLTLPAPVRVRASRAFLPISFLKSEAFGRWSGFDARYDEGTRTLEVERRTTVGSVRAFSYKGRTRLALSLASGSSYQAVARGVGALEVSLPYGVVEGDDRVDLDDGIVASYAVKQEVSRARLSIRFAEKGLRWRAVELADPRRLVVDVYGPGIEPADETPPPRSAEAKTAPLVVAAQAEKPRRRMIVIDPGHGGKDPGATGRRATKEKDVNLAVALELARVLRERGDMEVVLTREDDVFVPLSERSAKANELEADIFISLHCNAHRNHRENGFEVYSVSETASDPAAEELAAAENAALELEGKKPEDEAAKQILLAMTKNEMINESPQLAVLAERGIAKHAELEDRGAKQAGFYVLRGTHAPAILIEMAFLSHPKDETKLGSRRFRRKVAEGVAAGVADYARKKGWLH